MENIKFLEELAANAWRPAVEQYIDGWRLRFANNITQRANSVLPIQNNHEIDLVTKLELVEEFYQRQGCPPRFQITGAADPGNLAETLTARGYTASTSTDVQTADLAKVKSFIQPDPQVSIKLFSSYSETWMSFFDTAAMMKPEAIDVRRGILSRIGPEQAFAYLTIDGEPGAVGLGVYERGWVGVFGMLTHPDFRRRGAAKQILLALAEWGDKNGAEKMYLQVESINPPALALYESVGFVKNHDYYYLAKK